MKKPKSYALELGGRNLEITLGKFAPQANAACTVRYGDTVVLVTAVMSKNIREGINYFPLMVDYEEKLYAAGRIKSSRFMKREGRPSDESVLNGRLIDRALRSRFDHRIRNDVQVVITTLSFDGRNDPDVMGLIGASVCLSVSDIPWDGPLAAVHVGRQGDKLVVNPIKNEQGVEDNLVVAGDENLINMIELTGAELPETEVLEMLKVGQQAITALIDLQKKIIKEAQPVKSAPFFREELSQAHARLVREYLKDRLEGVVCLKEKQNRKEALQDLQESILGHLRAKVGEEEVLAVEPLVAAYIDSQIDQFVHELALKHERRVDGRALNEIRAIDVRVGLLPRTHGSGYFRRGLTEALSILTLAGPDQEQLYDEMEIVGTKYFMHHYNFPPFSVGEVRPFRGPGRREIGHGALAERALRPLIPTLDNFPYTIRIVTEILSSNGSSSMASVCGASLALFDAGVGMKRHVAGIAIGLMTDGKKHQLLVDIQGPEDHHGDMDLKIAGTRTGITALQMDVKIRGVSVDLLTEAFRCGRQAREQILTMMEELLPVPRAKISPFAPKVLSLKIPVEKIRDVIGSGGRMIHKIIDETGANIDIKDDGTVFVISIDEVAVEKAAGIIRDITLEPKVGEVYEGKVSRTLDFGAFVQINPFVEGMIHISRLAAGHVDRVEDVLRIGDRVKVEVREIDSLGRINLKLLEGGRKIEAGSSPIKHRPNNFQPRFRSAGNRRLNRHHQRQRR